MPYQAEQISIMTDNDASSRENSVVTIVDSSDSEDEAEVDSRLYFSGASDLSELGSRHMAIDDPGYMTPIIMLNVPNQGSLCLPDCLNDDECGALKYFGLNRVADLLSVNRFKLAHQMFDQFWKGKRPLRSIEAQIFSWQLRVRRNCLKRAALSCEGKSANAKRVKTRAPRRKQFGLDPGSNNRHGVMRQVDLTPDIQTKSWFSTFLEEQGIESARGILEATSNEADFTKKVQEYMTAIKPSHAISSEKEVIAKFVSCYREVASLDAIHEELISEANEYEGDTSCFCFSKQKTLKLRKMLKRKVIMWVESDRKQLPSGKTFYWDVMNDVEISMLAAKAPMTFEELCYCNMLESHVELRYGEKILHEIKFFIESENLEKRIEEGRSLKDPPKFQITSPLSKEENAAFIFSQWIFSENQLKALKNTKSLAREYQRFCLSKDFPLSFRECHAIVISWVNTPGIFCLPLKSGYMKIRNLAPYLLQPGERYILEFLDVIGVKSLTEFRHMKKSGVSENMEKFLHFREINGLPFVKAQAASRFFAAISQRFMLARNSPPLTTTARRWNSGALVIMSENTRKFLDDLDITNHVQFLEAKTMSLAKTYEEYRLSVGMMELKGKGSVASVSSWKGVIRDVVDCYYEGPLVATSTCSGSETSSVEGRQECAAPPLSIATISTHNPTQPVKASTKAVTTEPTEKASSAPYTELMKAPSTAIAESLPPYSALMQTVAIQSKPLKKVQDNKAANVNEHKTKSGSQKQPKTRNVAMINESIARKRKLVAIEADPMQSLSRTARKFLIDVDLYSIRAFLGMRTKELSFMLNDWRLKNEMSTLKEHSAITTVSSWKAEIRKRANPDDTPPPPKNAKPREKKQVNKSTSKKPPKGPTQKPKLSPVQVEVGGMSTNALEITKISKEDGSSNVFQLVVGSAFTFQYCFNEEYEWIRYLGSEDGLYRKFKGGIQIGYVRGDVAITEPELVFMQYLNNTSKSIKLAEEKFLDLAEINDFDRNFFKEFLGNGDVVKVERCNLGYILCIGMELEYMQMLVLRKSKRRSDDLFQYVKNELKNLSALETVIDQLNRGSLRACVNLLRKKFNTLVNEEKELLKIVDGPLPEEFMLAKHRIGRLTSLLSRHICLDDDCTVKLAQITSSEFYEQKIIHLKYASSGERFAHVVTDVRIPVDCRHLIKESASVLWYSIKSYLGPALLDFALFEFVWDLLCLITEFILAVSREKDEDDLLNALFNCTLKHYNVVHDKDSLRHCANVIFHARFANYEYSSADLEALLKDANTAMNSDNNCFQETPGKALVSARSTDINDVRIMPDCSPIMFQALIFPILRSHGWSQGSENSLYYPPSSNNENNLIMVKPTLELPESLLAVVAESYEKISKGQLPLLPASYSIKYCLDEWVKASGSDYVPTGNVGEGDYMDIEEDKFKDSMVDSPTVSSKEPVVQEFLSYFNHILFDRLLLKPEKKQYETLFMATNYNEQCPSDFYGIEYFLRFLLVLPDFLSSAGVSVENITKISTVAQPIILFLTDNIEITSTLEYQTLEEFNNLLARDNVDPDSSPLLLTVDRPLLTDFTYEIFKQVQICFAAREDIVGRRKSIKIGTAGMQCKWCVGSNVTHTNKFFSVNVESVAAVPSVIFSHVQRCPLIPSATRKKIEAFKKEHNEKRKKLKHGSQAKFYRRLWDRMLAIATPDESIDASGGSNVKTITKTRGKRKRLNYVPATKKLLQILDPPSFASHQAVLQSLLQDHFNTASCKNRKTVTKERVDFVTTVKLAVRKYYAACKLAGDKILQSKLLFDDATRTGVAYFREIAVSVRDINRSILDRDEANCDYNRDVVTERAGHTTTSACTAFASRKRLRQSEKDPNTPKRYKGSFVWFTADERPKVHEEFPGIKFVDCATLMGERWRNLSLELRQKYEDIARADKDRYAKEMVEYEAKKKKLGIDIGGFTIDDVVSVGKNIVDEQTSNTEASS